MLSKLSASHIKKGLSFKVEKPKEKLEPRSIKIFRGLIVGALILSLVIFFVSGVFFVWTGLSSGWEVGGPESFGYFGSFIGGVLGPAVAAASLLLILKTLKVQMEEMAQTNESLALSAQLNKQNIQQQRNNFVMGWSLQRLSLQNLNALKDITYVYEEERTFFNAAPEWVACTGGVCDFMSAASDERSQIFPIGQFSEIEKYLKRLVYLAVDTLDYLESGGNFHYKKDEIAELLTLLKPFGSEQASLVESLKKLELLVYIKPLSSAYNKVSKQVAEKDDELLQKLES